MGKVNIGWQLDMILISISVNFLYFSKNILHKAYFQKSAKNKEKEFSMTNLNHIFSSISVERLYWWHKVFDSTFQYETNKERKKRSVTVTTK